MSSWWARRATSRRTAEEGDGGSGASHAGHVRDDAGGSTQTTGASQRERPLRADPDTPSGDWEADAARAAEMAARFRARAARREAQRDLQRLRERHWSGQRLIEEGRTEAQWWEHPEADPYAVLGLLPGARIEEASAARRKVAQTCHPDRLAESDCPDLALRRMVAANAAYDRLRRALHPV